VGFWWLLTFRPSLPVDVRAYWAADPRALYPSGEDWRATGYLYSPAFELVIGWGRLLPFEVFAALWRGLLLAALVVLAGPLTIPALFVPAVASEINAGNIQLLMAVAIVAGFRWSGAFVLLTKLTPGVGLVWFALRHQWRDLALAIALTGTISLATAVAWPDRWAGYLSLLAGHPAPAVPPWNLTFWQRLPVAVAFLVLGGWRGWRWPVIVAATAALPVFYTISPSMLVGVLPFARVATGRWLRGESVAAITGRTLPAQASPGAGAILAP